MPPRPLEILELAAPGQIIAGRQGDLRLDALLQFGHEPAEIASADVDADVYTTLGHLAPDLRDALPHFEARQAAHGDIFTTRRLEQDALNGRHTVAERFRIADDGLEAPFTLVDVGGGNARDRGLDDVVDVADVEAMPGDRRAVDDGIEVMLARDPVDLDIAGARNGGRDTCDVIGQPEQHREVVAEDLDRDVRAHTCHHFVDAVRDRLRHDRIDAGEAGHHLPDVLGDVILRPPGAVLGTDQLNHEVALVVAGRVDGRLPASETRDDVFHPRDGPQTAHRLGLHADRLVEGDVGDAVHIRGDGAFPQLGDERSAEERHQRDGPREGHHRRTDRQPGAGQCTGQQGPVGALEGRDEPRVMFVAPAQHVGRQHGRERQRQQQRDAERNGNRIGQGREHLPFHALQRHQRQEYEDDDADAEDDRRAHFTDSVEHHTDAVASVGVGQPCVDVLDDHDRAIHHQADGDGQSAQGHEVRRQAPPVHHQEGQ